jgi:GTP diphosphokinase / guanosine-3',5'-bis(diphosphate) 3'-diphosphatase
MIFFGSKETDIKKNLEELKNSIREYYPDADISIVEKAYNFSTEKHKGQFRQSGEPYYIHPVEVATTLTKLRMDIPSITSALLHDIVEDTEVNFEDIQREFGTEVRDIVDGLTKLAKYNFKSTEEAQAENFRKMIMAMAKDIRVIIVKLADRLHNMRTLNHLPQEKQQRIAQETLDIYAPIAHRLGISWLKTELEDLAFMYLDAETFADLVKKVQKQKTEKEKYIQEVIKIVQDRLSEFQIKAQVSGRLKNYFSISNKMKKRNLDFDQIYDLIAFRIIVEDVTACYEVLGIIHSFWKPVPGRFKDYIAMPKPNNYQSLHTTVIGPYGERVEIQIRTPEMHKIAEYGIAAHWLYKEGHMPDSDAEKFTWLRSILETDNETRDSNEFMDSIKMDFFSNEVYIFTPRGEVKELPVGSTPIDFAYSIHTNLGNTCVGAKVNDLIVPLKSTLRSGDIVEIITSKTQTPKKDWLKFVKTAKARNKIRVYLRTIENERSRALGQEMLERELKKLSLSFQSLNKEGKITEIASTFKYKNLEELLTAIGYGKITPKEVARALAPDVKIEEKEEKSSIFREIVQKAANSVRSSRNIVKVSGADDLLIRFAKCCTPVQGEQIVGFITRGRGITIHRKNCPKLIEMDEERLIEVNWDKNSTASQITRIRIETADTAGLLAKMSKIFAENDANVAAADIKTNESNRAVCIFDIRIQDITQLNKIMHNLRKISGVLDVSRMGLSDNDEN